MNAPQLPPETVGEIARQIVDLLKRESVLNGAGNASVKNPPKPRVDRLPPFATAAEVGALVNLTPRTLRRKVLEGRFPPPIRVGKRAIRWKAPDVYGWIEELEAAK
jgi:predicted DNA-binding transcriptional regulator AlpA